MANEFKGSNIGRNAWWKMGDSWYSIEGTAEAVAVAVAVTTAADDVVIGNEGNCDLVGNSAGTAPLAGRSRIGISASNSGIPVIFVGKSRKNSWREGN